MQQMVAIMLAYDPGSLFFGWQVFLLVSTGLALAVYVAMIPGRIAKSRCHPQATAIMVAGIVGGLLSFGLLWFVALIWAFTARSPSLVPKARSRMTWVECGFAFEPPSDLATPHCPKFGDARTIASSTPFRRGGESPRYSSMRYSSMRWHSFDRDRMPLHGFRSRS